MKVEIVHRSPTPDSFRAAKVQGMFDIPSAREQVVSVTAELPLTDRPWQLGAIVGASGSGKSSIARRVWPEAVHTADAHDWRADTLLDDFPLELNPSQVVGLLTAVGFSSPPAWLRPYRVLSTGQQFRASLARSLAQLDTDGERPVVFDEFTSTVDRTVAKAVCVSAAKHVRRSGGRFVAVTCHKDVVPWLTPDWHLDTDTGAFTWGSVQRPGIGLCVREGSRAAWRLFRGHHYLTADLSSGCRVWLIYVQVDGVERLAGFMAVLDELGGWWRGHRIVVLPDLQGLGIGNRMISLVAEGLWRREHARYREVTSAPGIIAHRRRHPEAWRLTHCGRLSPRGHTSGWGGKTSANRLTTSWVYLPEALRRPSSTGS